MKNFKGAILTSAMVLACGAVAFAAGQEVYQKKAEHKGGDVNPKQAQEMLQKDPQHTFLVDIRTQYEYQDIGHPAGAYNIPFKFYTTDTDEKGYKMAPNPNFCSDLKARFNPEADTLVIMCRSGHRSADATSAAVDCGFQKSVNLLDGFEGDKVKDKNDPNFGKRTLSGWRAEGLAWTYDMDQNLMYAPDVKKPVQK